MPVKVNTYNPLSEYNIAIKTLIENNIRPTKQRRILAKILFDKEPRHVSADNLFIEIKKEDRKISLGMKWMVGFTRKRNEKTMCEKLAAEILAAYKEEGASIKKKTEVHKMAEANKAFSHFRF